MSGRYRSKVFNFFSRQSLRLQDQSTQAWRRTKLAAAWGAQILLYPVYVGFQAMRLTGKQLRQASRTLRQLRAVQPAADMPIRKTLEAIESLEVQVTGQPLLIETYVNPEQDLAVYLRHHPEAVSSAGSLSTSSLSPRQHSNIVSAEASPIAPQIAADVAADVVVVQIQGVASLLGSGSLVLVTTRNQILDGLSFKQQLQLTRRIALETADYWQRRRQLGAASAPANYLPLAKPPQHAWWPLRAFHHLMSWMQRGSIAGAANLFQEAQLARSLPAAQAELRSAQSGWITAEAQFNNWLNQIGQAVRQQLTNKPRPANALSPLASAIPQPEQPRQTAPEAKNWLMVLDRWLSRVPGLQELPYLPTEAAAWLTMEDLFQPSAEQASVASTEPAQSPLQPPARRNASLWQSVQAILPGDSAIAGDAAAWELVDTAAVEAAIKQQLNQKQRSESRRAKLSKPQSGQRIGATSITMWDADLDMTAMGQQDELMEVPLSSLDTANQEEDAMLPPSWIETEAQLVGYVKHPLEQLLEWLDQGMVWVEVRLGTLWRWLTRPIP